MRMSFVLICVFFMYSVVGQKNPAMEAYGLLDQKKYREATDALQQALAAGQASAELYYNMGNAYLGQDSIGKAVLYYEKALKLSPYDEDTANNLKIAKSRVVEPLTELDEFFLFAYWRKVVHLFSPNVWAWLSLISALGLMVVAYLYWYRNWQLPIKWLVLLISGLLAFLLLTLIAGNQRKQEIINNRSGIVMTQEVLRSGPDKRSDNLKTLYPGYKVKILDELDGWYKIRTVDREVGWILPTWIEKI